MVDEYPIDRMVKKIRSIKRSAGELKNLSGGIEAVDRNVDRILASVKMLEINIVDVADLVSKDRVR
jgi:hypothetical protein